MIQYKHYHDITEGYKDAYSKNANPDDVELFASLGAFIRTNDSCFTYLPLDGKGYFLQVTNKGEIFSHGLVDSISVLNGAYAAEYIGQLESKNGKDMTDQNGNLPDGKLPLRRADWGFHLARQLRPIFARVVDALLYTNKPVILVGDNVEELVRYIKTCLALFPVQYANTIGFSVCPDSLPSFVGDKSNVIGKNVRLIATDCDLSEDDAWEVIHVKQYKDSGAELRPYAKAVEQMMEYLISGNGNRLNALIAAVCPCFAEDGKVDTGRLANALAVYKFMNEANETTATAVLQAKVNDKHGDIRQSIVLDAANILFGKNTLSKEDEALIENIRKDEKVNEYIKGKCGEYAFKKMIDGATLTNLQQSDVMAFLGELNEEDLTPESDALRPLFVKRRNTIVLSMFCKLYSETQNESFLQLISAYVHILDTYNYKQQQNEDFDAKIFEVANAYPTCAMDLIGAMMLSCYLPQMRAPQNAQKATPRLNMLASQIQGGDAVQKIEHLMRVKAAVEKCADIAGVEIRGADDFDLLEKKDVAAIASSLTFANCLQIVNEGKIRLDGYITLQDLILGRLCTYKEVRANVTISKNLREYRQFMETYRTILPDTDEIAEYIAELTRSGNLGNSIFQYRMDFVLGCYKNMPLASRYRIAKKSSGTKQYEIKRDKEKIVQDDISRVLESREAPFDEKQKITESIIDEMRLSSDMGKFKNSTLNSSYLMYAYFFGFLFAILAAGLLLSLPMISATVLGVDMLTRIGRFIEFYHIIIVFAVAALNVLCYWICWVKSRHDRIGSLKKSIKVTLLYGILPVAVYVIAYAIAYFAL